MSIFMSNKIIFCGHMWITQLSLHCCKPINVIYKMSLLNGKVMTQQINLANTLLISSLCHVNDPQRTQRTHQCGTLACTVTLQWGHYCGYYTINLKNYCVKNRSYKQPAKMSRMDLDAANEMLSGRIQYNITCKLLL